MISAELRGQLKKSESLARYTSWHVGGPARQFYKPADLADLAAFMQQLPPNENCLWLGLGSNVLIRDGGFAGTVIVTQGKLNQLQQLDDGTIRAEAGVTCAKLAKLCARSGFENGAFFAGVPGTVGGALAMNAGAFGGETWPHVIGVEMMGHDGNIYTRAAHEFNISYREVKRPLNEWFVAGHFRFAHGNTAVAETTIRQLLQRRSSSQPIGQFSCGSVFRNPPNDFAGRLIEACGLKGYRIGGACVSPKHANFIINEGKATAADIENLIEMVAQTVKQQHGIQLTPEVHIIGEKSHG